MDIVLVEKKCNLSKRIDDVKSLTEDLYAVSSHKRELEELNRLITHRLNAIRCEDDDGHYIYTRCKMCVIVTYDNYQLEKNRREDNDKNNNDIRCRKRSEDEGNDESLFSFIVLFTSMLMLC